MGQNAGEVSRVAGSRGKTQVTMSDVARVAGVSVKTVSNVVNDYVHVKPSTRERVQLAIDSLGYQMNLTAQTLRRGRSGAIGLAVPDLVNPYFAAVVQGVIEEAEARGFKVFIELTGGIPTQELGILTDPLRSMTDGLILALTGLRHGSDEDRLKVDFPLVVLGDQPFGEGITQVTMSNVEGARAATEYLFDRGANRVAFLGWHSDRRATSELRYQGYLEAFASRGFEPDPALVLKEDDWSRMSGAGTIQAALERGVDFDGVFAINDVLAIGAIHALNTMGVPIPGQVQVIGFDNLEESRYTSPSLTTVDPSIRKIARDAVRVLTGEIDGSKSEGPVRIVEPFTIVGRGTTGEPAGK